MNIHHFWPKRQEAIVDCEEVWTEMIELRQKTWKGFAEIEERNGFISPVISVNTSRGQEVLRLLSFRIIEEAAESVAATTWPHRKEEAIDAINYLFSLPLLDGRPERVETLKTSLSTVAQEKRVFGPTPLNISDLGQLSHILGGRLADTFRNRAWMKQSQDMYFAGGSVLRFAVTDCFRILLRVFQDFDEFARYFIAKDRVLQFRLRSNY